MNGSNINRVHQPAYHEGNFFFYNVDDENIPYAFYKFDHNGNPILKFDYENPFLGNLRYISDFSLNENLIDFIDPLSGRIIQFNHQTGEYQKTLDDLPIGYRYYPFGDQKYLFYSGTQYNNEVSSKTQKYFYLYDQNKGDASFSFSKIPACFASQGYFMVESIYKSKEEGMVLCTNMFNDTIFAASVENFYPKYVIDFPGGKRKREVLESFNNKALQQKPIKNTALLNFLNNRSFLNAISYILEYKNYFLFIYNYAGKKQYISLFDRETQKITTKKFTFLNSPFDHTFFDGDNSNLFLVHSSPNQLFSEKQELAAELGLSEYFNQTKTYESNPIIFQLKLDQLIEQIK